MYTGIEGISVSWGITAVEYCWFWTVGMQAIGQKALGRIHLYASMFLTQQYYSVISYNYKHSVLSSWYSNYLYFIM